MNMTAPMTAFVRERSTALVVVPQVAEVTATSYVPFARMDAATKAPQAPTVCLRTPEGGFVEGVAHCIYVVIPQKQKLLDVFLTKELAGLADFIAEQDARRMPGSMLIGGFLNPLAFVAKVRKGTTDYRNGKRWSYCKGEKTVLLPSLEHLYSYLGRER